MTIIYIDYTDKFPILRAVHYLLHVRSQLPSKTVPRHTIWQSSWKVIVLVSVPRTWMNYFWSTFIVPSWLSALKCSWEIVLKRASVPPYVHTIHVLFPFEILIRILKCRTSSRHCAACFEMLNCTKRLTAAAAATATAAFAFLSPTLSCSVDREATVSWWRIWDIIVAPTNAADAEPVALWRSA